MTALAISTTASPKSLAFSWKWTSSALFFSCSPNDTVVSSSALAGPLGRLTASTVLPGPASAQPGSTPKRTPTDPDPRRRDAYRPRSPSPGGRPHPLEHRPVPRPRRVSRGGRLRVAVDRRPVRAAVAGPPRRQRPRHGVADAEPAPRRFTERLEGVELAHHVVPEARD